MKKIQLITLLATLLLTTALLASPSFALDVYLVAQAYDKVIDPDGDGPLASETIPMWGFALADATYTPVGEPSSPGPRITVPSGDTTLNIHLQNNLAEAVSIVIPGQSATLNPVRDGSGRVTSLTNAVAGNGGQGTYTWSGLKPGTFIYHSASNLGKQVQMGLYGPVTVAAPTAGQAYPGVAYDNEVVLFYSEIDPALHDPPAFAHPNDYAPCYFLVNGQPYPSAVAMVDHPITVNETVLVRMFNAGLDDLVPTINGLRWDLIAEDGNPYPYAKNQNTALLSAMKTRDALLVPSAEGSFAVFDRRLNLANDGVSPGGMLVQLGIANAAGGLTALDDAAITQEDTPIDIAVLANDSVGMTVESITQPANGSTTNNNTNVTYSPNPNFTGSDAFTYRATDGANLSNWATVTVTVTNTNDPPTANPDSYEVTAGETLTVGAPGVLENDSDPDSGDTLEAVLGADASAGSLTLAADGSFTYTPNAGTTADLFTYHANDGTVNSAAPATVSITVAAAPANQPPVANDDFATAQRGTTGIVINLTANDTDPDGNLDPTSVTVGTLSARGGAITNLGNGSVVYVPPRRNFRGTDTFPYTVADDLGAISNEATVQVNVVR